MVGDEQDGARGGRRFSLDPDPVEDPGGDAGDPGQVRKQPGPGRPVHPSRLPTYSLRSDGFDQRFEPGLADQLPDYRAATAEERIGVGVCSSDPDLEQIERGLPIIDEQKPFDRDPGPIVRGGTSRCRTADTVRPCCAGSRAPTIMSRASSSASSLPPRRSLVAAAPLLLPSRRGAPRRRKHPQTPD